MWTPSCSPDRLVSSVRQLHEGVLCATLDTCSGVPHAWTADPMTALSVIIPTFNEVDNVAPLVEQLNGALRGHDAEIIFVDDSTDATPAAARTAGLTSMLPVRVIHRDVPTGRLAGAVVTGLRAAHAPWAIVMDGDLQHPPSVVAVLYQQAVLTDADVVVGSRYVNGQAAVGGLDSRYRRLVSSWSGRTARALFPRRLARCTDPMSGFFAVRLQALDLARVTQNGYKILLALLIHRNLTVVEVPFVFGRREAGRSKATLAEGMRYLQLLLLLRVGTRSRHPAGHRGALPIRSDRVDEQVTALTELPDGKEARVPTR